MATFFNDDQVQWDSEHRRPKRVTGEFSLPVGDSTGDVTSACKDFIESHATELQLAFDDKDLETSHVADTPTGRTVRFKQSHNGIEIYGTEVLVRVDNRGYIRDIRLRHESEKRAVHEARDSGMISRTRAVKAAQDAVGQYVPENDPIGPQQIYFPVANELRLSFRVVVQTMDPPHEWEIVVDAFSSEILSKRDIMTQVDGEGFVFDPNPVVTANDNTLRDPNAAGSCGFEGSPLATIDAERVTRTLPDLDLSGGTHKLDGTYVRITNFLSPNINPPEEANANDFKYSSDDPEFDAVNVYYHIETVQRYLQGLGITTAHPAKIDADVRVNQSWASYSPSSDNMRFGHSGDCRPERASDGHVALHEYGHAIQHSQVPGWGGSNPTTGRNETGAMGEGYGDILACLFFSEHGGGFQREVFEDWIFGDINGLRRVDGTKMYPDDWSGSVHADGEIWSAALWNIYRATGGDSATQATRVAARDEVVKTVTLSHHRMAADGTMPDGAEAYMDENSELEEFRLSNGIEILNSFHDRGILACEMGSDLRIQQLWSQQNDSTPTGWEQVEAGQDNWFYAQVKNHGTVAARAFVVTFNFKSPFATPVYPNDFRDNVISGAVAYDLAPGATTTVKARWPKGHIPPIPAGATRRHGCILAEVYNPCDQVAPGVTFIGGSAGKLKQRNTDIVDLLPDETTDYFLDLGNYAITKPELVRLEVIREPQWSHVEVAFHHENRRFLEKLVQNIRWEQPQVIQPEVGRLPNIRVLEATRIRLESPTETFRQPLIFHLAPGSALEMARPERGGLPGDSADEPDEDFMQMDARLEAQDSGARLTLNRGLRAGLPMVLEPRKRAVVKLQIRAPREARPGDTFTTVIRQRTTRGEIVGDFEIIVNVVDRKS